MKQLKTNLRNILSKVDPGGFNQIKNELDYNQIISMNTIRKNNKISLLFRLGLLATVFIIMLVIFINNKGIDLSRYNVINDQDLISELNELYISKSYFEDLFNNQEATTNVASQIALFLADDNYDFYEINYRNNEEQKYIVGYIKQKDYLKLTSFEEEKDLDGQLYINYLENNKKSKVLWIEFNNDDSIPSTINNNVAIVVFCNKPISLTNLGDLKTYEKFSYFLYKYSYLPNKIFLLSSEENQNLNNFYNERKEMLCLNIEESIFINYSLFNHINKEYYSLFNQKSPGIEIIDGKLMRFLNVPQSDFGDYDVVFSSSAGSVMLESIETVVSVYDVFIEKMYLLRNNNSQ